MKQVDAFYRQYDTEHRWHLDLHCSIRDSKHYTFAIHPFISNSKHSKPLLTLLESCKIEACVFLNTPVSTFSWYTAEYYGAHSATIELGKVAKFGENDVEHLADFIQKIRMFLVTATPIEINQDR